MFKRLFKIAIVLGICYVAYITNPSEEEHIDNAYKILNESGIEDFGVNSDYLAVGEGLLGREGLNNLLGKFIVRKNYYLFSLTEIDLKGEKSIVAVGLFGHIFDLSMAEGAIDYVKGLLPEQN
ncbi:MAG: hypothetical protein R3Y61_03370 [Rikenellaceae bacterium]